MVTHSRRGSALSITIIVLMVAFTLGSALLSLTTGTLMRSKNGTRSRSITLRNSPGTPPNSPRRILLTPFLPGR